MHGRSSWSAIKRCAGGPPVLCESNIRGAALREPIVEPERVAQGMARRRKTRGRGRVGVWLRRAIVALVAVALLPVVLTVVYLPSFVHPVSVPMLGDLLSFRGYDRRWVPIEDISPNLVHSVIMSEDGQFCRHHGVDFGELKGVVNDALAGEPTRGASTIPMQTVKNLFLWNSRSFVRKAIEAPLALYFDLVLPKRRIMEIYLNIAEWGPGIYGAEAAAQFHFRKPAKNLNSRESALLAVTLPNPILRNPARPSPGLRRLAARIQRLAANSGGYVGCVR